MPVPLPLRGPTRGDVKMVSGRGGRLRCGADVLDAAWAAIAFAPPRLPAGRPIGNDADASVPRRTVGPAAPVGPQLVGYG